MKFSEESATVIAKTFSKVLRKWLTKNEMSTVIMRNRKENSKDVCHSHDFCDANMAMDEAFKDNNLDALKHDPDSKQGQRMVDLWNRAWDLAKKNEFYYSKKQK